MTLSAIIVDNREPKWVQDLAFGGVPKMIMQLDHGDIMMTTDDDKMVIVERKTPSDLLGSIADGRLMQQAAHLRDQTPWAYLVVTGQVQDGRGGKAVADGRLTGWSWASVEGALLSVQELGVPVVHAAGDADFEPCVLRLANRNRDETPIWPNRPPRVLRPGEQMLACLPGIGMERAQKLYDHFGTVCDALEWLTNMEVKDQNIAGIGMTTRRSVRRALQLSDREWLAVRATPPEFGTKEG